MCGISGFLDPNGLRPDEARTILERMNRCLAHRGPDDAGLWMDVDAGVALGHRRLSILDLSPAGHQPMLSASGRYTIVYNGEVYNWREIRRELEADLPMPWRGHSDTEVVLAALERWGLEATLARMNGMFALVVWDREFRALHLCRDRVGEKPLYYGWSRGVFLFASELKAMRSHPAWRGSIDRAALSSYMQFGYVPSPHGIYEGIRKVSPGCIVSVPLTSDGRALEREVTERSYWSMLEVARAARNDPFRGSPDEAVVELEALLRDAVALRSYADVPVGTFLSGGIDSSTVAALMQAQARQPIRTFSVGFRESAFDEAAHARAVAEHLGTRHTELYVTPADALAVVPRLPSMFDEPFADSSQIPTFLVAQLARRDVTVTLSGDGGDELFAGYNRHVWNQRLWRGLRWIPAPAREAAARGIGAVPTARWDALLSPIVRPLGVAHPGASMHKLAGVLDVRDSDELYMRLVTQWTASEAFVRGGAILPSGIGDGRLAFIRDATERMLVADLMTYLPDDILVKVDRTSMSVSLESRVPLIDHRVVEFALRLPLGLKLRDGQSKWVLRRVLDRYVPRTLVDRPKSGFSIPLGAWLRGPLRAWADELLNGERLTRQGWLDVGRVQRQWQEHLRGSGSHEHRLWTVLMFQAWLDEQ